MPDVRVLKDLNAVTYDGGAMTGAISMSYSSAAKPQAQISDAGAITSFVISGGISGTFSFSDPIQAATMASKTSTANLVFAVKDEKDAAVSITITKIKTGSVVGGYSSDGAATSNVPFVADSLATTA